MIVIAWFTLCIYLEIVSIKASTKEKRPYHLSDVVVKTVV